MTDTEYLPSLGPDPGLDRACYISTTKYTPTCYGVTNSSLVQATGRLKGRNGLGKHRVQYE